MRNACREKYAWGMTPPPKVMTKVAKKKLTAPAIKRLEPRSHGQACFWTALSSCQFCSGELGEPFLQYVPPVLWATSNLNVFSIKYPFPTLSRASNPVGMDHSQTYIIPQTPGNA